MTEVLGRLTAALADRYVIERELGAGGMATVYLAHDVRHDRRVAVKVLLPELAAILGASRFLKEIRTTANLQHPHILPLHDSGEADGLVYYVMPFVEGESLRDRISRETQLPVDDAIRITQEVAEALHYAHTQGVIHRDIKPENILLHGGHALVADFGIALAASRSDGASRMTETGMSLGTPAYMAPEQAMGQREITPRADVYALGVVLYEMLSGEPPFTGPTAQAIVARVMTEEPRALVLHRHTIPPHVEAAVRTALEKLPADRFATAAEFAAALADTGFAGSQRETETLAGSVPRRRRVLLGAAAGILVLAAGAGGHAAVDAWLNPRVAPPPVTRVALHSDRDGRLTVATGTPIAFAPDGSRFVYVGTDSAGKQWLFVRGLDRLEPTAVPGTRDAEQPFFSPDGAWLGFVQGDRLREVPVAGGAIATIADAPELHGATWAGERVVFSSRNGLFAVPAGGGRLDTVIAPDTGQGARALRWPEALPDGHHVLVTMVQRGMPRLFAASLSDGVLTDLHQDGMHAHWVDGGFVAFVQTDGTLYAAPFDARRLRLTGPPRPVASPVAFGLAFAAKLGVSRTGAVAFTLGEARLGEIVPAWVDAGTLVSVSRSGVAEPLSGLPEGRFVGPRLSPDGRRLAVAAAYEPQGGNVWRGDIWVYDVQVHTATRLTFDSLSIVPAWTPDGRSVVYSRVGVSRGVNATDGIFTVASDGSGLRDTLLMTGGALNEPQFTPDGRTLVYRRNGDGTVQDIWLAPADTLAAARPLTATPFAERSLSLSPDGRWLAYVSDETGAAEVYVRTLAAGSGHWRVSLGGGREPRWAHSGRELFFRNGDTMLVAAVLEAHATFRAGAPHPLFTGPYQGSEWTVRYDVTPDDRSFIMVREPRRPAAPQSADIQLVLNWFDQPGVRRRR